MEFKSLPPSMDTEKLETLKANRSFACGCSEESRAASESWLREVLPGLEEGYETILTGEKRKYTLKGEEKELDEHKEMTHMEDLFLTLEAEANKRHCSFRFSIGSDMWCALGVNLKPWGSSCTRESKYHKDHDPIEERDYGAKYDYGLMEHALAAVILQIREDTDTIVEKDE